MHVTAYRTQLTVEPCFQTFQSCHVDLGILSPLCCFVASAHEPRHLLMSSASVTLSRGIVSESGFEEQACEIC